MKYLKKFLDKNIRIFLMSLLKIRLQGTNHEPKI